MIKVNDNFLQLSPSYLFSDIAKKVSDFQQRHPDARLIRMGIGDVTRPICPAAIEGLRQGAADESQVSTFKGYGPEQGHAFLREAIAEHDYARRGIDIRTDEIFISDGAKSDIGNLVDILSTDCRIAVTDPVYPVYVDTNVMSGRAGNLLPDGRWSRIEYLPCTADNDFIPALPVTEPDVIYLCYPNNPTGTVLSRKQLAEWVGYALSHNALIIFDSAYEAYITDSDVPHSIYEIEGGRQCAIEVRSFSKTAGFTGLRCGYTVVPDSLYGYSSTGARVSLRQLWTRRQTTKFNGASYVVQCAAARLYTPEGRRQVKETIDYYMANAAMLRDALTAKGLRVAGGENSPYVWLKTPAGMPSWDFFYLMLSQCNVVCTPGAGFGPSGEGYCRLTGFSSREATAEAVSRFDRLNFDKPI